jgi:hypothetical protein
MTWAEVAFCDIDTRLLFTAVVKGFIIQAPAHPTHFKVLRLKLTAQIRVKHFKERILNNLALNCCHVKGSKSSQRWQAKSKQDREIQQEIEGRTNRGGRERDANEARERERERELIRRRRGSEIKIIEHKDM